MLKKLIGYDSKMQIKFLGGIYGVVLLIAAVSGILQGVKNHFPQVNIFQYISAMAWVLCCMAVVVMIAGSVIFIVLYFRKNLLKDEGYLMHTLPVSSTQLYISKLLTGTVFVWISIAVGILCLGIGALKFDNSLLQILEESGLSDSGILGILVTELLALIPMTLCQFYASMVMGYTWRLNSVNPVNRDLLSVIVFVILYIIQQIMGVISLVLYIVIRYGNPFSDYFVERFTALMDGQGEVIAYVQGVLGISLVLSAVMTVVLLIISLYRMNRHLNLE